MSEEKGSLENLRLEYSEVNNNRRHYSNLRFAILTVFFAVVGGVASVAFGIVEVKSPTSINIVLWSRFAGLVFTLTFFSFEVLCEFNISHFGHVAKDLEELLGYRQFKTRTGPYAKVTRSFIWGMYTLIIVFWIFSICRCA
jgi:hypothetical protein